MTDIAIIDGGGANIASLQFALKRLGADSVLTTDKDIIRSAQRVILPGVGAAADAMERLQRAELVDFIPTLTQPLLGICLGMQLLFESSEEDNANCLGILDGRARLFEVAEDQPVPHMGWNKVSFTGDSQLFTDIPDGSYFYFVHSYAVDVGAATTGVASYGRDFTAIAGRDNFMGAQFHPERSGRWGAQLLKNFLQLGN
ncbi:MAG: imidazole glycerol phosphate synthase subunit HisH [Gammaproteobacteria bacterium]